MAPNSVEPTLSPMHFPSLQQECISVQESTQISPFEGDPSGKVPKHSTGSGSSSGITVVESISGFPVLFGP